MSILSTPERRKNGGTWETPTNGNHSCPAPTPSTANSRPTPSKRLLSKAEKLALRERARVAMTPPGHVEEEMEYQKRPQRTPLSMAIAMKAATSPSVSSFPDSFWTPFLEQEEYDRRQMSKLLEQTERRRKWPDEDKTAVRRLSASFEQESASQDDVEEKPKSRWYAHATSAIRGFLTTCLYLGLGLFVLSCVDAPYLRRVLPASAAAGRLCLGLCFWLCDFIARDFLQRLPGYYEYLTTDGLDDFLDYITDLQIQINDWVNRLLDQ